MKELSIEEKAKAYDEAVKKLKVLHDDWATTQNRAAKEVEEIFPELKEEPDEKMWKLIKKYAHYNISDLALEADHITREHLVSWLEKQGGEKRPVWSEEDERERKHCVDFLNHPDMIEATPTVANGCKDWLKSLKDRVQLKQEWSDEDEDMIQALNTCINAAIKSGMNYISFDSKSILIGKVKNWLKSLRPQNKWKESLATADLEKSLCDIQDRFSDTSYEYKTLCEAIEFIRCTEQKPQWKPSDEQIKAFEHFVRSIGESGYASPYNNNAKLLYSLLSDLKKLKE